MFRICRKKNLMFKIFRFFFFKIKIKRKEEKEIKWNKKEFKKSNFCLFLFLLWVGVATESDDGWNSKGGECNSWFAGQGQQRG